MHHTPWVGFDDKNCGGCKHLNERGYCEFTACIIPCTVRATIPEVKPQTNADRIRAMTDEELAAKIEELCQYTFMQISVYSKPMGKAEWLEWLKQEVSE